MPSAQPGPFDLATTYLRLRNDASIEPLPVNDDFWPRIMSGALGTFHHEYLVTMHGFDSDWPNWEAHPNGDEVVCLLKGRVTMVLELEGREHFVELSEPGGYVLVPRGTWHTARTRAPCRMLFITAGEGTQHRPARAASAGDTDRGLQVEAST
jgi:mannose-6-phosphate isomerase-like protein (cupin superfamily)